MRPIGNSPRETTVLRLEQAKSFSFGVQFLEEGRNPIDVTDCEVRFATKAFQREATHTTLGTVRIDLQAEDLQTPGSFPYVVTLVTSGGYASAIMKGTIDVLSNADLTLDEYSALTPPQNVEVRMRGTQVVQIAAAPQLPPAMTAARAARVDGRGHLILTMEDGNELDVGKVVGDPGPEGPPGGSAQTLYTWTKYADTPVTGMSNNPEGKAFRGVAYNKTSPIESTNYADYTWERIQGPPGAPGVDGAPGIPGSDGQDGTQLYTWLKYADTPTSGMSEDPEGKTYIGLAYNQSNPVESNDYADYLWSKILGEDGVAGAPGNDGQTYWTWVKYATGPNGEGIGDLPGKAYIGLAFNKTTPVESSSPADYQWTKILGDPGQDGVAGAPGADGQTYWTWVKYATGPNGEGMGDQTGKPYIGLAFNKTTPVESTDPADYQWTKIIGENGIDGVDGVPGAPGADGTERWTWVKYADSAAGAGMSDLANGKAYIGLAFNKTTSVESSNPIDYQWTKILGEDGNDGLPGTPGADGTEYWTWVKYADSAAGAGMADSAAGKAFIGLAFNKTTPVESTNPADYQWTKILGTDGAPGLPGADGQPRYTWIKYATGPSGEGMSDSSTGMVYIGLAFNKESQVESSNPADYQWSLFRGTSLATITPFYQAKPRAQAAPVIPTTMNPPAAWTTTEPEFQLRWNLYRTERIVYDNDTFAYTPVSLVTGNFGASYVAGMVEASTHVGANPPTGEGSPFEGQMWWITNASNNFAGLQRYNGTMWQNYRIMADSVIAAKSISAPLLEADLALASKIQAGESTESHTYMNPTGIHFMSKLSTGVVSELLRINSPSSGEDAEEVFSLRRAGDLESSVMSISESGDGSFNSLSSAGMLETVWFKLDGETIEDVLSVYPRGVIEIGGFNPSGTVPNGARFGIGQIGFIPEPNRLYAVRFEGVNVNAVGGWVSLQLRWASNATPADTTSTDYVAARFLPGAGHSSIDTVRYLRTGDTLAGGVVATAGVPLYCRLDLQCGASSTATFNTDSNIRATVTDLGASTDNPFGRTWTTLGRKVNWPGETPPATPTPAPAKKDYTYTGDCTSIRTYNVTGGAYNSYYANKATTGSYNSSSSNNYRGFLYFGSLATTLSGADIVSVEAYVYMSHWTWNAGGSARVGYLTNSSVSAPTTLTTDGSGLTGYSTAKPGGAWVKLPSACHTSIKDGTFRAFVISSASLSKDYYGYATSGKIRVKYRK